PSGGQLGEEIPVVGQQRRERSLVAGAHTAEEPKGEGLLLTRHLEERTREATSIHGIATELFDALETHQGGRLWGERQDVVQICPGHGGRNPHRDEGARPASRNTAPRL